MLGVSVLVVHNAPLGVSDVRHVIVYIRFIILCLHPVYNSVFTFMSPWFVAVIVGVLSVGFLWYLENIPGKNGDWSSRVGSKMADLRDDLRNKNMSAFVVGYTGEVGKALVKELLTSKVFSRVVLIGRRQVQYEDELYKDVEQKIVDFEKLGEYSEAFQGLDVGFCCLGTTRGKSGAAGFYKVDHDYVMSTAVEAFKGGCSQFHLVSSQGANKDGWVLYPKTKGQVEEEMKEVGFDRLFIYRPAMLLCKREERRIVEGVFQTLLKPMAAAFPTVMTTPTTTLATAMINAATTNPPADGKKWQLFSNKDIFQLAGELGKKTEKN